MLRYLVSPIPACHPKTLCLFQSNDAPSSLDLSHLGLRPPHAGPTLQALQGCRALYSLSLAGNRLGGGATISSLAHMNTLHTLDLTCTGISTQVMSSNKNILVPYIEVSLPVKATRILSGL